VIIPNLLYFGKTFQNDKYQLQDQVELIKTLSTYLKIEKFDLIGISYGGLVAIEFCNQNIEIVKKIILVDSPIKYFNGDDLQKINNLYKVEKVEDLFAPKNYQGLKKQFKAAYYYKKLIPDFIYKILFENLCLPNIENWEKLILELESNLYYYSIREYKFNQSTLLIWGEKDDIVSNRIAMELNLHLNNSKLVIIEKAKHLPNIEQSMKFNKIMIDFLLDN
jgi:pimeloyl-ACP methyl ester carboxylesterase